MTTIQFFERFWTQVEAKVIQMKRRIADHMSLYPEHSDLWIQLSPANNAFQCILDILVLEFLLPGTRTRHQTFDQRERMAYLIKKYRRQGYWKVVEEMIQQPQGLIFLLQVLVEHFSPEDLFGNLVPAFLRRLASAKPQSKETRQRKLEQRPVARKSRRRGYNDHGSLRPSHQWTPEFAYAKPAAPKEPDVVFYAPRPFQWVPLRL